MEKTPTLSVVAPLQDTLAKGLKPIEGESAVIKEMQAAMAGDLQKWCINLKATLHACSAMDPRFKSLPFLTENEREEVYDGLIAEAARLSRGKAMMVLRGLTFSIGLHNILFKV